MNKKWQEKNTIMNSKQIRKIKRNNDGNSKQKLVFSMDNFPDLHRRCENTQKLNFRYPHKKFYLSRNLWLESHKKTCTSTEPRVGKKFFFGVKCVAIPCKKRERFSNSIPNCRYFPTLR